MSRVHNYILLVGPDDGMGGEEGDRALDEWNHHLRTFFGNDDNEFQRLDEWAGGAKAMEADVWGLAANYQPDLRSMCTAIAEVGWCATENIQLLYKLQHQDKWTLLSYHQIVKRAAGTEG